MSSTLNISELAGSANWADALREVLEHDGLDLKEVAANIHDALMSLDGVCREINDGMGVEDISEPVLSELRSDVLTAIFAYLVTKLADDFDIETINGINRFISEYMQSELVTR